jgi:hypothetical protein
MKNYNPVSAKPKVGSFISYSIEKSLCKVVPLYVVGFIISWFTGALG